jgi:hypothetical protein
MFIMVLAEGVVVMLLGCLGRFRCQARSLGRCVVVVWRPARGRLASYLEPCVLRACVCVCSCLCLLRCACGVLFCTGAFVPLFFCLI